MHADRTLTVLLYAHFISTKDFFCRDEESCVSCILIQGPRFRHLCPGSGLHITRSLIALPICILKLSLAFKFTGQCNFFFILTLWNGMFSDLIVCMPTPLSVYVSHWFLGDISELCNKAYYGDGQPWSINTVGGQQSLPTALLYLAAVKHLKVIHCV